MLLLFLNIFWEQVVEATNETHFSHLIICTKEVDWLLNPLNIFKTDLKGLSSSSAICSARLLFIRLHT